MTGDEIQDRLDDLRSQVDDKDRQIVRLLSERARIVMRIKDLKAEHDVALYDPRREEEIYTKVIEASDGTLYADALRDIYDCILRHMKEL